MSTPTRDPPVVLRINLATARLLLDLADRVKYMGTSEDIKNSRGAQITSLCAALIGAGIAAETQSDLRGNIYIYDRTDTLQ